jgi:hypothetical protein
MKKPKKKTIKLGKGKSIKIVPGYLHRATGTPLGQPIPAEKKEAALRSSNPRTRKAAELAKTMAGWHK